MVKLPKIAGIAINLGILLATPVYLAVAGVGAKSGSLALFLSLVFSAALLFVFLVTTRTWGAFFIVSAPFVVLAPVCSWYYSHFGEFPDESTAMVLATSSIEEAESFIDLMQLTPVLALCAAVGIVYLLLALMLWNIPIKNSIRRGYLWLLAPALTVPLLVPVKGFLDDYTFAPSENLYLYLTSSYPVGGLMSLAHATLGVAKAHGFSMKKSPYQATFAAADGVRETHVLVIGESARYDTFQVNGYQRETSPFLAGTPNVVSFSRAYTPANLTVNAVPMMLTGIEPRTYRPELIRGTILDAAREAGYYIAWLSNQETHVTAMFAPSPDSYCMPSDIARTGANRTQPDGALLPCLDRTLANPTQRRFIVLHTYGSHTEYAQRVPDGLFQFSGVTRAASRDMLAHSAERHRLERDIYDDTIAYTDKLLQDIVLRLKRLEGRVTLTYISDHGESLQHVDGQSGHGFRKFTVAEAHVPLFIWVNDNFVSTREQRWRQLLAHRDVAFRTERLFDTLSSLLGIDFPERQPEHDITDSRYRHPTSVGDLDIIAGNELVRVRDAVDWEDVPTLRTVMRRLPKAP